MKLTDLIAKLSALVEADPYRADMQVVFGPDCAEGASPEGGIVGRREGLAVLMIAPLSLADSAYQGGGF
jgi:hypothetical protein